MRFMQKAMEQEEGKTRELGAQEEDVMVESGGRFKGRGELDSKVNTETVREVVRGEVPISKEKGKKPNPL